MKSKVYSILCGILIGIVITSLFVFASKGVFQKTLEYDNINVTLDGEVLILTDALGNYVEPFTIEGTTYLPLRAISSALGLSVEWKEESKTVNLVSSKMSETGNYSSLSTGKSSLFQYAKFPLYLYSNDGKTYLGKLISNKYDTESIFNEYGSYGSEYRVDSIWNEYGQYGSKYSSKSAFNEYASSPPVIVDSNYNFVGYLTANKYKSQGITIYELMQILTEYNQ